MIGSVLLGGALGLKRLHFQYLGNPPPNWVAITYTAQNNDGYMSTDQ